MKTANGDDADVFTRHVRSWDDGDDDVPTEVFDKLRRLLRGQLRKRNLLSSNAGPFGYSGRRLDDDEVLSDLVGDAYARTFFGVGKDAGKQRGYLMAQVRKNSNIDALVHSQLGFFVHDLHRAAYPREAAIFKNVMGAGRDLLDRPEGDIGRIRDGEYRFEDTSQLRIRDVLAMGTDSPPPVDVERLGGEMTTCEPIERILSKVTRKSREAVTGLCDGLYRLMSVGVRPVRLADVRDVLKDVAEPSGDDEGFENLGLDRTIGCHDRYEHRQTAVDEYIRSGLLKIERSDNRDATRQRLRDLLRCIGELSRYAGSKGVSQATIARHMDMKKQTLSDWMKRLQSVLETSP